MFYNIHITAIPIIHCSNGDATQLQVDALLMQEPQLSESLTNRLRKFGHQTQPLGQLCIDISGEDGKTLPAFFNAIGRFSSNGLIRLTSSSDSGKAWASLLPHSEFFIIEYKLLDPDQIYKISRLSLFTFGRKRILCNQLAQSLL